MRMLILLLACASAPDIQVDTATFADDSATALVVDSEDTANTAADTATTADTSTETAEIAETGAVEDTAEDSAEDSDSEPVTPSCWIDDGEAPTNLNVGFVAADGHDGLTGTVMMDVDTAQGSITLPACGRILSVSCANGTAEGYASTDVADYGVEVTFTLTQVMSLPYGQGFSDRCNVDAEGYVDGELSRTSDVIYVYY